MGVNVGVVARPQHAWMARAKHAQLIAHARKEPQKRWGGSGYGVHSLARSLTRDANRTSKWLDFARIHACARSRKNGVGSSKPLLDDAHLCLHGADASRVAHHHKVERVRRDTRGLDCGTRAGSAGGGDLGGCGVGVGQ